MTRREHAVFNIVSGVISIVVQLGLLALLLRRMSNKQVLLLALVSQVVASLAYALMWAQWQVFIIASVSSLGMLAFPAITALKSNALAADEQGAIQGALSAVRSIGAGLGPMLFNELQARTQSSAALIQAAPFWVAAVMGIAAVAVAVTLREMIYAPPLDSDVAAATASESAIVVCDDAQSGSLVGEQQRLSKGESLPIADSSLAASPLQRLVSSTECGSDSGSEAALDADLLGSPLSDADIQASTPLV